MRIYFLYILVEIIKYFFIGISIFISLISMTQFLQLTEFVLIHNVSFLEIIEILGLMSISFLPIVMPMSLLFSILLTYSRLSSDSEIIALNSFGYSLKRLALPAIFFSIVVAFLSTQLLFNIGPIARFQFDTLIQRIGSQKIIESLNEKMFLENFFDLVIYFNEKGPHDEMKNVFIKDSRNSKRPLTVIAKMGVASVDRTDYNQSAKLDLYNGKIIDEQRSDPIVVNFEHYSVKFNSPINIVPQDRDLNTYIFDELIEKASNTGVEQNERKMTIIEIHRRLALAAACIIFGFLGAAQGMSVNRRAASSKGFVTSVICLTVYWILLAASQSSAEKVANNYWIIIWGPNLVFISYILYLWKKTIAGK